MLPDYRDKKILIIEDFPEFRFSLKGMIQQLGVIDIDMVANGELAIISCYQKRYDIILSDYNLGDGKDGQQVLEELIHRGLLKPTTIYVMITAENTTEMVMGALEYTPDSYLTKPFTKSLLKGRLDKLIAKKFAMEKINRAITLKDYMKAIKHCDELIQSGSKYKMACLRIKTDLYDKMGDYGHSKAIYSKVIEDRPVSWALMGMGKLLYAHEDYQDALTLFQQVVSTMPTYPEALDWLSRLQQVLGDPLEAQQTLQEASKASPKAILRQMQLGNLALENKDFGVARRAFKTSIKLGRDSCYKTPDNYLKLVSVLREYLTSEGGIKNKRLIDEAFRVLTELEKEYPNDQEIKLRAIASRHSIYHKATKTVKVDEMLDKAKILYFELKEQLSGATCADVAKACKESEDFETCHEIITNILAKFGDDKELMASLDNIIEDKTALAKAAEAGVVNNAGMKAASGNDIDTAIESFRKAISMSPDNVSFNMNLVQVLFKKVETTEKKAKLIDEALNCLKKLDTLQQHDHRFLRFQQLQRIANDLKIGIQSCR